MLEYRFSLIGKGNISMENGVDKMNPVVLAWNKWYHYEHMILHIEIYIYVYTYA